MLTVLVPTCCLAERRYACAVVFGEWLGIPYRLEPSARGDVCLRLAGTAGELHLPDTFFAQFAVEPAAWLTEASLFPFEASIGLPCWDSAELAPGAAVTSSHVPVLCSDFSFAADGRCLVEKPLLREQREGPVLTLPLDVFGAAFFMLSRYEEAAMPRRDRHGRFPACASLASRAGFLHRPVVDEYVEILWVAMRRLWPSLRRSVRVPRTFVTCDVDRPFAFSGRPISALRSAAAELVRRRSPGRASRTLLGNWRVRYGDQKADEHRQGLEFIMDVCERLGHPVAFYLIPECTDARYDIAPSLNDPRMCQLILDIRARGHELGIHPGYDTHHNPEAFARSVRTFRRTLDALAVDEDYLGGRQHYLRWRTPTTARLWEENGLAYDSTLGYAETPGFRCGTCREYPLYDLAARRALTVRERPLILMETSVFAEQYLGLGPTHEAFSLMQSYRSRCRAVGGDFTLLWHNSNLDRDVDREFYEALLS